VTLGQGSLLTVSTKQKCISKSSTEAELIAVTDLVAQAIELKKISEEIIGEQIKLIVNQDNESTIKIMKSGIAGARSKHIKIPFAWIKEAIDSGDFELRYKATNQMLADGLTKAKQVNEFKLFKAGAGIQSRDQDTKERAA